MSATQNQSLLSVIVPAYKTGKTILDDLKSIESVLKQTPYKYEIICVVDGISGKPDKTSENAHRYNSPHFQATGYETNHGKGYAIRYGMARAKGELVAFIDSGRDLDPSGLIMLMEHMKWYDADIIVGSKRHPASIVHYPWLRRVVSFGYQQIVRILFGMNLRDTQTGLKIYKRQVLEKVLPRLLVKRFAFDIEMLAVAHHLGFRKIFEAPIKLDTSDFIATSTMSDLKGLVKNSWNMLLDTAAVFYRLRILHYYDDNHKRSWIYDKELAMRVNTP